MSIYALLEEVKGKLAQAQHLAKQGDTPTWLQAALFEQQAGVSEIKGSRHDAQVLAYLDTCHKDNGGNLGDWGADRDETPWCSAFVNWCTIRAGIEPTRSAAARSWLSWGLDLDPTRRKRGAVVVLTRKGGAHVALDTGETGASGGWLLCGGNQGNRVSIASYAESRVQGYRWPEGF